MAKMKCRNLVFKYGARPPAVDGVIRQQIQLERQYYNHLVEAENLRRIAWGYINSGPIPEDEDARNEFWETIRDRLYAAPFLDVTAHRRFAKEIGLYWGSYLMSERAFAAAEKSTSPTQLLRYKSWRKGGVMGVQVQKNVKPDSMFRISDAPDPRTGRRAGQRKTVVVRVGSTGRDPVWSESVKIEQHRPLQGRPTWCQVCLKYHGDREVWTVNITCADVPGRVDLAADGVVAIDVGWRAMPNGNLRIAFAKGDDGAEYELKMPITWRELGERADRIRSDRDEMLNIIAKRHPTLARHKKPRGARHRVLREEALAADIELQGWCRWDRHLEEYELGCRRRSMAARRDAMRVWLRTLRRRYATAVIKDSAHKEMKDAKRAKENGMQKSARRQGHHAAPGEVIEEVCKVFGRETGVAVVEAPGTTSTCVGCGGEMEVGAELMVCCEWCGAREDRDRVSTRNLLARFWAGEHGKPTARKQGARFAKRHKKNGEGDQCQPNG